MRYVLGVRELLNEAKNVVASRPSILLGRTLLDPAQLQGVDKIADAIAYGGMSVGVGPPGTGKTVMFNVTQSDVFEKLDKSEVIVYVAPTNRLVEECTVRTLAYLLVKGFNEAELGNLIRVYGSRFKPEPLKNDVKIVFTTPFQPGALKDLSRIKDAVHLMVDEASTTPLHGPFIELAMSMVKAHKNKRMEWLYSFSVIGDPMQAIAEGYKSSEKFKLLIVGRTLMKLIPEDERKVVQQDPPKIFELANKHASSLGIKYFFLDNTYRIPKPTELLVSIPFYNEMLKGVESYKQRLKDIKLEAPSLRSSVLERCRRLKDEILHKVDNALDSQIPIVYVRDRGLAYTYRAHGVVIGRRPQEIDELDVFRAELASEIAAYLFTTTVDDVKIDVLTPYTEMKTQIQLTLKRLIDAKLDQKLRQRIRVSTIHSALGSEADIIVVALGKEYKGDETTTIYFQTPELINVQFSRHKKLLVIIGNIERLVRGFEKSGYAHISRLTEALNKLRGQGLISEVKTQG